MDRLEQWLAGPHAIARIFSISGIGGIGKTTLLAEMAHRASRSSALALWLDGQGELATSGTFLSSLELALESEYGRRREPGTGLLPHVVGELSRQRTVLMVDNGERLDQLEGWLLTSFLPQLESSEVLLVVASRGGLSDRWHMNPAWGGGGRIETFPLGLFTRAQVMDYLRESGLVTKVQTEVVQKTDGHPLLLSLTVDLLRSRGGELRDRSNEIPAMLSADWLREAASPALHRALTALSLLPAGDPLLLNALLDKPVTPGEFHELASMSFVRATPQGLSLHHVVSRLLRDDYSRRHPQRFQSLRHRALRLLAERFRTVDRRTQMRIASHVLELYREFLPSAHAYVDFSSALRPGEPIPYRPEDLPFLHRFLADSLARADWQSELVRAEDCHAVLDEIALHSPEGFCIVRSDTGIPLGFCAGFRLHVQSVPLLERFAPSLLPMLGEESVHLRRVPAEAADTLCILLAAVDVNQSWYGPEELGAMLMQQWLIHMTSGWRAILFTSDPQLSMLLPILGFQAKDRHRQDGSTGGQLNWWELDFRHITFEEWVQRVIQQTASGGPATVAGQEPDAGIDAIETKQILHHLSEYDKLEQLPIVRQLRVSGAAVQACVRAILTEDNPPFPLTRLEQRILWESFLCKELNKNQLAEAFHMSRTTFYRHSQQAVSHLAHVLTQSLADGGKGTG